MTIDFGLLILAHLYGDYILQNDWMAKNKSSSWFPCFVHVALYTLSFVIVVELTSYAMSHDGWPAWAYVAIGASHYPFDRYGLARKYMGLNNQVSFRDDMGPWSVIIVDNTLHLLFAWFVWMSVHMLA